MADDENEPPLHADHGDVPTDVPPAWSAPVGYEPVVNPLSERETKD